MSETNDEVTLDVKVCPAIKHLRAHGREIVPVLLPALLFHQRSDGRARRAHRARRGRQRRVRADDSSRAIAATAPQDLDAHQGGRMIGCYDFCGHYEWTFEWLAPARRRCAGARVSGTRPSTGFADATRRDSIVAKGIAGMKEYWGHTLDHEGRRLSLHGDGQTSSASTCTSAPRRASSSATASNNITTTATTAWAGSARCMKEAGFVVDHEHNHCGQCWWEMRREEDAAEPSGAGELSGEHDVRLRADWKKTAAIGCLPTSHRPR